MIRHLLAALTLCALLPMTLPAQGPALPAPAAARFVELALHCVHREYPNKIAHVMTSDADARPPRELTPVFYGCFDWHSSVHGHWLLVRACRTWPEAEFAARARAALNRSFTPQKVAGELAYLNGKDRSGFERPYGLAWLLCLCAELREWKGDADAKRWAETLAPMEKLAVARFSAWLPKLGWPIRTGEHSQTAFALGLALDHARITGNPAFAQLIEQRCRDFYAKDRGANLAFEPSGHDFLSPLLAEADVMRRVLPTDEFAAWLAAFLPRFGWPDEGTPLQPAVPSDRSDGKIVHLDGLNLARAWMLEGIAGGLPAKDPRRGAILKMAAAHAKAGLDAVSPDSYEGGHWLGSFSIYLVTRRGL